MMKARLPLALLPVALIALVAMAGCGGSSGSGTTASAASSTTASSGATGTIDVANNSQLGQILTDSKGDTVYVFDKDTNGKSACSGSCANIWPPVTASGSPKPGNGVAASKLGTTTRSDGSTQVTYAGRPLYTYTADASPGDTTGNGINEFGAVWHAVGADGSNAPADGSSGANSTTGSGSTSTTGGSSGGGYGY
jgi:predicted lipoprotein with Yx(FWY)xxD motif